MKLAAGSRVLVDLWDEDRPATVIQVINFTDRKGEFHERRLVSLDEPLDGETRWNVEFWKLKALPDPTTGQEKP